MAWVDNINTWTGLSMEESVRMVRSNKCLERITNTIYYKFCIFKCFSGIALKKLICLVFLVCNIFICVTEYAPSNCFY